MIAVKRPKPVCLDRRAMRSTGFFDMSEHDGWSGYEWPENRSPHAQIGDCCTMIIDLEDNHYLSFGLRWFCENWIRSRPIRKYVAMIVGEHNWYGPLIGKIYDAEDDQYHKIRATLLRSHIDTPEQWVGEALKEAGK